ncbi:MAG: phosphate acetyltransferase [Erysipelotrichaceae bacterium]|nr:phosphate acetyltransferase [Erysipelotrichaceae bacterium]
MILDELKAKIVGKKIRIVLTEGWDYRIQEAAMHMVEDDLCVPVLLGTPEQIESTRKEYGYDLTGVEMIDPATYPEFDQLADRMHELRKNKMTRERVEELLHQTNYFGTMLVETGRADGLLGGATYSTADTVRPALQLVKAAPGQNLVSSCFLLVRGEEQAVFGDCGININPTASQLVDITIQTANSTRQFGKEPVVALLSFSTNGSAEAECVTKMRECLAKLREMPLDFEVDGEMQFDCAVDPEVARLKFPESKVAGRANTFIFPNISAGNIGYKIAARMGGYIAMGPILQGLNAPINDLSRGCNWKEVYNMAIITANQKELDI